MLSQMNILMGLKSMRYRNYIIYLQCLPIQNIFKTLYYRAINLTAKLAASTAIFAKLPISKSYIEAIAGYLHH
jgi:hypothetical protein